MQLIFTTVNRPMHFCLERLFKPNLSDDTRNIVDRLYSKRQIFYEGYCNDPRNTDNAWLEVLAAIYHDDDSALANAIEQVDFLMCCNFGSATNDATTLSRTDFSGYVGHVTLVSWMFTIACCLVAGLGLGLGLGLDLVSRWLMVIHTCLYDYR